MTKGKESRKVKSKSLKIRSSASTVVISMISDVALRLVKHTPSVAKETNLQLCVKLMSNKEAKAAVK